MTDTAAIRAAASNPASQSFGISQPDSKLHKNRKTVRQLFARQQSSPQFCKTARQLFRSQATSPDYPAGFKDLCARPLARLQHASNRAKDLIKSL